MKKIKPMKAWWLAANKEDKEELSALSGVPLGQLGQLAGKHRTSSAAPARRIELATIQIAKTKNLPVVLRSDLCPACAACEFAPKCRD